MIFLKLGMKLQDHNAHKLTKLHFPGKISSIINLKLKIAPKKWSTPPITLKSNLPLNFPHFRIIHRFHVRFWWDHLSVYYTH